MLIFRRSERIESMSFIRKDIFTGANVLISEIRGKRPMSITSGVRIETPPDICPFCPGNEHMTPLAAIQEENWETRVFPNKYPALTADEPLPQDKADGFYGGLAGGGSHEIFVDTRSHSDNLKDFSVSHITDIIRGIAGKYKFYADDGGIKHIQIFKNKGARAGASQSHSHWQIMAGGFVPLAQELLAVRLSEYAAQAGGCLYCDVLAHELSDGRRIIFDNGAFVAFAPYASRFAYETWIVPRRHFSSLSELNDGEAGALAEALKHVVAALERVKENVDYNVLFMDSPKTEERGLFHWHVQIMPKMGTLAGYEHSTGGYINHVAPEKAAERLRVLPGAEAGKNG